MSYYYRRSEPELWTVGHDDGDGRWWPDSHHSSPGEAAERVAYLNGNPAPGHVAIARHALLAVERWPHGPLAEGWAKFEEVRLQAITALNIIGRDHARPPTLAELPMTPLRGGNRRNPARRGEKGNRR